MAAAVKLAVAHVRQKVGDRPVYIFGYSNGGALAVLYALSALEDTTLPAVDKLILMSPQIAITKAAALATWQARLGRLLGLKKMAWNSILPEYDPFKYKSFAINAGNQSYLLTLEVQARITSARRVGQAGWIPADNLHFSLRSMPRSWHPQSPRTCSCACRPRETNWSCSTSIATRRSTPC